MSARTVLALLRKPSRSFGGGDNSGCVVVLLIMLSIPTLLPFAVWAVTR